MRRPALYSSSRSHTPAPDPVAPAAEAIPPKKRFDMASPRVLWSAILLLSALLALSLTLSLRHGPRAITQEDIDKAVLKTMETQTLPSEYAKAYDNVRPAVVRVVSYIKKSRLKEALEKAHPGTKTAKPKPLGPAIEGEKVAKADDDEEVEQGVGTGVVIIDKGVILTNLHVVAGADHIKVTFFDGLEADASVTGVQPEN